MYRVILFSALIALGFMQNSLEAARFEVAACKNNLKSLGRTQSEDWVYSFTDFKPAFSKAIFKDNTLYCTYKNGLLLFYIVKSPYDSKTCSFSRTDAKVKECKNEKPEECVLYCEPEKK